MRLLASSRINVKGLLSNGATETKRQPNARQGAAPVCKLTAVYKTT